MAKENGDYDFDDDEIAAGDAVADKSMRESEEFRLRDPEGWVAQSMKDCKALLESQSGVVKIDVEAELAKAEAGYRKWAAMPPAQKQPPASADERPARPGP